MSPTSGTKQSIRALLLGAVTLLSSTPLMAADVSLELRIKAAFILNFARYVSWPAEKFQGPASPIRICVLEPDPFGSILDDMVREKRVDNRALEVSRSSQIEKLSGCHLLYLSQKDPVRANEQLERLRNQGMVTVHETTRAIRGGVFRFFLDDNRVRFELNTAAADREKLKIAERLKSVAVTVSE